MLVSLDIETKCGLGCEGSCKHALDPYRNAITIIGAYWEANDHVYTKIFRSIAELESFDEDYGRPDYLGFNFKWDLHTLKVKGFDLPLHRWAHDPLLMSSVFTEKVPEEYIKWYEVQRIIRNHEFPKGMKHRQTKGSSLKILAPYFLDVEPFWEDPTNHDNEEYVLKDCKYTYMLYIQFRKFMEERGEYEFYEKKLLPWVKLLARMERRGVMIDLPLMDQLDVAAQNKALEIKEQLDVEWADAYASYRTELADELVNKYQDMFKAAKKKLKAPDDEKITNLTKRYQTMGDKAIEKLPNKMNIDSPAQIKWLLKDHFGLDIKDFDDEESTGKAVLERLAGEGRKDLRLFLEYKKNKKLTSAFFPSYRAKQVNSIIHCTFNGHIVRTGRLSSSDPNLQQVPGFLHQIFMARPGYKMIVKDEAAIEPRLIAALTGCPIMFDILDKRLDFHGHNTKIFFDLKEPVSEIKNKYEQERLVGKEVGLAILYGAGKDRLMESAQKKGFVWSEAEAKAKVEAFRAEYETVYRFRDELKKALLMGNIMNLFGRPVSIPNPDDIHMQGLNTAIQSSASDLVVDAALYAQTKFDEEGLDAHILLLVHDEIVAEASEADAAKAEAILDEAMTRYKLTTDMGEIKLKVEGKVSDRWEK